MNLWVPNGKNPDHTHTSSSDISFAKYLGPTGKSTI